VTSLARRALMVLCLLGALRAQGEPRFTFVDVWVDTGDKPLAAWQVEVQGVEGAATQIVGIEGGDSKAFRPTPFYDTEARLENRVVLADYTLAEDAPKGRFRVARVHIMETGAAGEGAIRYTAKVVAAAAPGGEKIAIEVEVVREGEKR